MIMTKLTPKATMYLIFWIKMYVNIGALKSPMVTVIIIQDCVNMTNHDFEN